MIECPTCGEAARCVMLWERFTRAMRIAMRAYSLVAPPTAHSRQKIVERLRARAHDSHTSRCGTSRSLSRKKDKNGTKKESENARPDKYVEGRVRGRNGWRQREKYLARAVARPSLPALARSALHTIESC